MAHTSGPVGNSSRRRYLPSPDSINSTATTTSHPINTNIHIKPQHTSKAKHTDTTTAIVRTTHSIYRTSFSIQEPTRTTQTKHQADSCYNNQYKHHISTTVSETCTYQSTNLDSADIRHHHTRNNTPTEAIYHR